MTGLGAAAVALVSIVVATLNWSIIHAATCAPPARPVLLQLQQHGGLPVPLLLLLLLLRGQVGADGRANEQPLCVVSASFPPSFLPSFLPRTSSTHIDAPSASVARRPSAAASRDDGRGRPPAACHRHHHRQVRPSECVSDRVSE
eukprot:GHVU01047660.1.p2 GENE.GHVU01047660.1~~GHVU01047660.1.p2  ORF type:complete len:145 (-),score=21.62 GHVU01047660.1:417-851(-)